MKPEAIECKDSRNFNYWKQTSCQYPLLLLQTLDIRRHKVKSPQQIRHALPVCLFGHQVELESLNIDVSSNITAHCIHDCRYPVLCRWQIMRQLYRFSGSCRPPGCSRQRSATPACCQHVPGPGTSVLLAGCSRACMSGPTWRPALPSWAPASKKAPLLPSRKPSR